MGMKRAKTSEATPRVPSPSAGGGQLVVLALQRKPARGARGGHLETGVDKACDLQAGQGSRNPFDLVDFGGAL